ncbi:MAG: hypothetical protein K0S01_1734 [Herbinix sp.]|nr:hypothetical protein [Herbinix sp.]
MKLLYGTSNQAKLSAMREYLKELDIDLIGIKDLAYDWPEIDESGNDPLENARIKALAYYKICNLPVFSCDSGLYIEGLEASRQPGVHVRNINGKRLSDQEMTDYYSSIAENLGGKCIAQYKNAICFVKNKYEIYEYMEDDISGEKFELTNLPHEKIEEGFPLDRISVHIKSGEYYYNLKNNEATSMIKKGFQEFFKRAINNTN